MAHFSAANLPVAKLSLAASGNGAIAGDNSKSAQLRPACGVVAQKSSYRIACIAKYPCHQEIAARPNENAPVNCHGIQWRGIHHLGASALRE